MPNNILKRLESRTASCGNFVKSFAADNSGTGVLTNDNHLYCIIGRETDPQGTDNSDVLFSTGDGAWLSDLAPPMPTQNLSEFDDFWNMAIAAKRILPADIYVVAPRRNWTTATAYIPYTKNNGAYQADPAYVITDLNEVWLCVVAGVGNSTVKPIRTGGLTADNTFARDGKLGILTTGDGYTWKYLYTLTPAQLIKLNDDWIPVPVGTDQMWSPDTDPQFTQAPDEPHTHIFARHVAIKCLIDAGANGSGLLPADLSYRQIALMRNPLNLAKVRASLGVYYQKNTINGTSADQLAKKTGQMLHLTNVPPQLKTLTNSESFTAYLTF